MVWQRNKTSLLNASTDLLDWPRASFPLLIPFLIILSTLETSKFKSLVFYTLEQKKTRAKPMEKKFVKKLVEDFAYTQDLNPVAKILVLSPITLRF